MEAVMTRARIHHKPRPIEPVSDRLKITFDVDVALRRRLRVLAAREDSKLYSIITEALEEYLAKRGA
jgi:hypothetical protein